MSLSDKSHPGTQIVALVTELERCVVTAEDALAAFRQVDLKGKRTEERVPIIYLTAICLHQIGKTDDGIEAVEVFAQRVPMLAQLHTDVGQAEAPRP